MCRIFGFRSIFKNKVHSSLIHAENALGTLSQKHRDGWGVAYYLDDVPHLIRSVNCAFDDHIFHQVSGVVSSENVVAHIRNATQGTSTILNSHPFQYGKWIFAHNGNVQDMDLHKEKLLSLVSEKKRKYILGSTDSEIIFHIVLTQLNRDGLLYGNTTEPTDKYTKSIRVALENICHVIGPLTNRDDAKPTENYLTFVLTNGPLFFGFQGGQPLHYSTHKSLCSESETCKFYDASCENRTDNNKEVNHLLLSSEPLEGVNIWNKMKFGEFISLDKNMVFNKQSFKLPLKA